MANRAISASTVRRIDTRARARVPPWSPGTRDCLNCYYDFEAGFPGEIRYGNEVGYGGDDWYFPSPGTWWSSLSNALWGLELDGQIVAVLSPQSILHLRPPIDWRGELRGSGGDVQLPWLRAATNVVVYALTRPGSNAEQRPAGFWERLAEAR
jgi:hypothetical protein